MTHTLLRQLARKALLSEDIASKAVGSRADLPGLDYYGKEGQDVPGLDGSGYVGGVGAGGGFNTAPHRPYTGALPAHMADVLPSPAVPFDYDRWIKEIAKIESGGKSYQAVNDKSSDGGSPTYALGKYQFVPSHWWDDIKAFAATKGITLTGEALKSGPKKGMLPDYKKYLDNPQLQEDFMRFYVETHLMPKVKKVREMTDLPQAAYLSDGKLLALMHYQGSGGAVEWLRTGKSRGSGRVTQYINRVT